MIDQTNDNKKKLVSDFLVAIFCTAMHLHRFTVDFAVFTG